MIAGMQSKSRVIEGREENHFFLKVNKKDSSTEVVTKGFSPEKGHDYRVVHNYKAATSVHQGDDLFIDPEYTIKPSREFPNDAILVKRLKCLYGITNLPPFFDPLSKETTFLQENQHAASCMTELGIFSPLHYKSFFLTQDYQQNGKYTLIVNVDGRLQVVSVDDRVPIYKDSLEPIWGLSFKHPWEFILIKAWAKVKGGYHEAKRAQAFEFIQAFSTNCWKFFNLKKEAGKFLNHYYQNGKFRNGKIVLKTRYDESVIKHGLTPSSATYQLIAIHEQKVGQKKKRFVLTIKSTDLARYSGGQLSFYEPQAQHYLTEGLTLDHNCLMTDKEFLQSFSSAYIASTREEELFSDYNTFQIQKYQRKAQHYQLLIPYEGILDLNILQFSKNKVEAGQKSRINMSDNRTQLSGTSKISKSSRNDSKNRYLNMRFILVRDNDFQTFDKVKKADNKDLGISKLDAIRGAEAGFPVPRFTTYEIQNFKGYSKGSTHFIKLDPGRYILRFKSENVPLEARYCFSWICNQQISIKKAKLTPAEQTDILHDSMVSIMHRYPHFNYDKDQSTEMIAYVDSFDQIGYGFTAIKCSSSCMRSIILKVNAKRLDYQGYRLKGKYKAYSDSLKEFFIKIQCGEYESLIFKKNKDETEFNWPSKAFQIYIKDLRAPLDNGSRGLNSKAEQQEEEEQSEEQLGNK